MEKRKIVKIVCVFILLFIIPLAFYIAFIDLAVEFTIFRYGMRVLFSGVFLLVGYFLFKIFIKWRNAYEKNRKSQRPFLNRLLIAGVLYVVLGLGFNLWGIPYMLAGMGLFPWDINIPVTKVLFLIMPVFIFESIVVFIWGMIRFAVEEKKSGGPRKEA